MLLPKAAGGSDLGAKLPHYGAFPQLTAMPRKKAVITRFFPEVSHALVPTPLSSWKQVDRVYEDTS